MLNGRIYLLHAISSTASKLKYTLESILQSRKLVTHACFIKLTSFVFLKGNKTKYNLVSETLVLLDVICGSTTGGLGLLGLYINENNVALINQILEALTEYCQVKMLLGFL